ncbi:hypothetical protein Q3G72_027677 [Acer saccharum]|nr:hypothetical protein Q3G72_027677 [Acer saccharum]
MEYELEDLCNYRGSETAPKRILAVSSRTSSSPFFSTSGVSQANTNGYGTVEQGLVHKDLERKRDAKELDSHRWSLIH